MPRVSSGAPSGKPAGSLRAPPVAPQIPDHEVLRCIGRGSYGEVWMARAVTGALRAVKVVRREDFELERTFEREFEGIRSFEPISRSHPGLIDILHVGRNAQEGFYYYVMELADDRYRGRDITPADYEPRTLSSDRREGEKLDLDQIIEVGLLISDALAHLHKFGLIHRDVKPSNIIFVNGVAQLADIGLVALSGQRTFVGTEGFVPPEGPGSPQADTYSLGMVLYELSTGRDRLEFPSVPDDIGAFGDPRKWRALNDVICRACAPEPRERYPDAGAMAEDLRRVLEGRRRRRRALWRRKSAWAALAAVLLAIALLQNPPSRPSEEPGHSPQVVENPPEVEPSPTPGVEQANPEPEPQPPPPPAILALRSDPPEAEVFINGERRGTTPLELELPAGPLRVEVRAPQHRSHVESLELEAGQTLTLAPRLEFWNPPVPGQPWTNSLGMEFLPQGHEHIARIPTVLSVYARALNGFPQGELLPWREPGSDQEHRIVHVPRSDAEIFRQFAEAQDRQRGYFGPDHYYRLEEVTDGISPTVDERTEGHLSFRLVAGLRQFGDIVVESEPPGAEIYEEGRLIGVTPHRLERHLTGQVRLELRKAGYESAELAGLLQPDQELTLSHTLYRSLLAVFDREWQNSLGMIFRPVGDVQFSVFETRVKDHDAYLLTTKRTHLGEAGESAEHPVVNVTRQDAIDFCRWLTAKEREEGRLLDNWEYRLPTDLEWSRAAGIPSERGETPGERHMIVRGVYVWGYQWPPPENAGNFADQSAAEVLGLPAESLLPFDDGHPKAAPVGRYPATVEGLHDLAGNVWEWVSDEAGGGASPANYASYGVLRGASWQDHEKDHLLASFRKVVSSKFNHPSCGFRIVLARGRTERSSESGPSPTEGR